MVKALRIYCLNFHMPHTVVLIIFTMLYITFLVLIYLVAEICIFRLSSSDSLSPPPTSGNHKSNLFFFECVRVLVCFWGKTVPKGYDSSCCNIVIQYFYTFQNDRHSQNSYYFSPYEDITVIDYMSHTVHFIPMTSPGEGNSNTLQCSCLKNPIDRGAW